ncbi:hypothetical protein ACWC9T_32580 [Kitasatospora sp. NPDC001159]
MHQHSHGHGYAEPADLQRARQVGRLAPDEFAAWQFFQKVVDRETAPCHASTVNSWRSPWH